MEGRVLGRVRKVKLVCKLGALRLAELSTLCMLGNFKTKGFFFKRSSEEVK